MGPERTAARILGLGIPFRRRSALSKYIVLAAALSLHRIYLAVERTAERATSIGFHARAVTYDPHG